MKGVNTNFVEEDANIEMDQEVAQKLFIEGGTVVLKNVPVGTEFGIDMNSWSTGPKFMGVKMIPPGVHFIYFSTVNIKEGTVSPRTGFFHNFTAGELLVRSWNQETENLLDDVSEEDQEKMKLDLRNLDPHLGVFPFQSRKKWMPLSNRIDQHIIDRLMPECGQICSVTADSSSSQEKEELNFESHTDSQIHYTQISKLKHPPGSSPREISKYNLDSSYQLQLFLDQTKRPEDILGEVQFSFLSFLVGQDYTSFNQWKRLVALLCGCDEALKTHPQLFLHFIGDLYFQMKEVPEDFFMDIVSRNNFLVKSLANLFGNVRENEEAIQSLKMKSEQLELCLEERFGWDFTVEDEEDCPVVVEL